MKKTCGLVKKRVGNKSDESNSKTPKREKELLSKISQNVSMIDDEFIAHKDTVINTYSENEEKCRKNFSENIDELYRKINELECNMRQITNNLQSEIDQTSLTIFLINSDIISSIVKIKYFHFPFY